MKSVGTVGEKVKFCCCEVMCCMMETASVVITDEKTHRKSICRLRVPSCIIAILVP